MFSDRPHPVFRVRIIPVGTGKSASVTLYGKDKEEKTAKDIMKKVLTVLRSTNWMISDN